MPDEARTVPWDISHCQLQDYLPSYTYGSGSAGKTSYKSTWVQWINLFKATDAICYVRKGEIKQEVGQRTCPATQCKPITKSLEVYFHILAAISISFQNQKN